MYRNIVPGFPRKYFDLNGWIYLSTLCAGVQIAIYNFKYSLAPFTRRIR